MVAMLTDDRLSSSSVYKNEPKYHPREARLSSTTGWSPDEAEPNPWIQVDFGKVVRIIAVVTKGLGKVEFEEWVKKYQVRYSSTSLAWTTVTKSPDDVFTANTDPSTAVRNDFPSAVEARYLRLYPTAYNEYRSLRFDVVGCEVTTTVSTTTTTTTTHAPTTTTSTTTTPTTTHAPTTTTSTTSITTTHAPTTADPKTTSTITTHAPTTTITPTTTSVSTTTFSRPTTITTMEESCSCVCVKVYNHTMTQAELEVRLSDIVQNLTVPKKTTSSYIRSKISVQDNRPEVVYVGSVGIVLLTFVVTLIILPDLFTFSRFLFKRKV